MTAARDDAAPGVTPAPAPRRRLAIVGGGSSGLITLKTAREQLPDWDIVCLEATGDIRGCWGRPYPGFVSTSTKYTTQFACHRLFDADFRPEHVHTQADFFRDGEYGDYLQSFAERFELIPHIQTRCRVRSVRRDEITGHWHLTIAGPAPEAPNRTESYDALVLCTGSTAEARAHDHQGVEAISPATLFSPRGLGAVQKQRVVVVGGGESAVDHAVRLAEPHLENTVYLSLRSGIRVSPRYHPIRGVPSDFLRNRLMLSIHPNLRNWIGERFVRARIRYRSAFQALFPPRSAAPDPSVSAPQASESSASERRKYWDQKLTDAARGPLFNVFHNKNDGFLDAVAQGRIQIVGPPIDDRFSACHDFDRTTTVPTRADRVVPSIGYRPNISQLTGGTLALTDFYRGCIHHTHPNVFLVGFARPVIGNVPTLSELQAHYVVGHLAGRLQRAPDLPQRYAEAHAALSRRFPTIDLATTHPVEMISYADTIARACGLYPSRRDFGSFRRWARAQLAPASTLDYLPAPQHPPASTSPPRIYLPPLLIALLLALKPVDWLYRSLRRNSA